MTTVLVALSYTLGAQLVDKGGPRQSLQWTSHSLVY